MQDLTALYNLNILSIGDSYVNYVYLITLVWSANELRGLWRFVTLWTATVWFPANFVHVIFHSSCLDLIIIKFIIIINWLFIFSVYTDFYLQG